MFITFTAAYTTAPIIIQLESILSVEEFEDFFSVSLSSGIIHELAKGRMDISYFLRILS